MSKATQTLAATFAAAHIAAPEVVEAGGASFDDVAEGEANVFIQALEEAGLPAGGEAVAELRLATADAIRTRLAAATLGRKGGQATSPRKAAAVRANGARGGAPRLVWSREHEWGAVRIFAAPKGWIVESDSRVPGEWSGRRVLIPYGGDLLDGADLSAPCNDCHDRGMHLVHLSTERGWRVLRTGVLVR